jgi:nitroimidazol reductase NimA-like FMN-containing flavoprotein (pyridoxamine 5'-phosphate oxidase superfamily)
MKFRPLRRFKQAASEEECLEILESAPRGILSVHGENGYPYGIPMNHWYSEEDGTIYFHSAKEGHKLDAIKACDKVSFCVYDEGWRKPGEWALNIRSVVVFGRISLVTDEAKSRAIGTALVRKFTDDEAYLEKELKHALPRVQCLALVPEHITGKLVNES